MQYVNFIKLRLYTYLFNVFCVHGCFLPYVIFCAMILFEMFSDFLGGIWATHTLYKCVFRVLCHALDLHHSVSHLLPVSQPVKCDTGVK